MTLSATAKQRRAESVAARADQRLMDDILFGVSRSRAEGRVG